MITVLLHGFWGQPSDWNAVLARLPLHCDVRVPDLYEQSGLTPNYALNEWGENFWKWVDAKLNVEQIDLVGYSMGARLAVTAALRNPFRVNRALFLSGNPILPAAEFSARAAWEKDWADRFATLAWDDLESGWQDQGVFAGGAGLPRRKTPQMREILGLSLLNWSPRKHPFFAKDVASLGKRAEWAFGALDQKYLGVAKSLQELPVKGQITVIPDAGHRLHLEAAAWVGDWIQKKD